MQERESFAMIGKQLVKSLFIHFKNQPDMKTTNTFFLTILLILSSFVVKGQDNVEIIDDGPMGPSMVVNAIFLGEVPSIESQIANGTFKPTENLVKEFNPKRWGSNTSVPGKGLPVGNDPLWDQQSRAAQTQGRATDSYLRGCCIRLHSNGSYRCSWSKPFRKLLELGFQNMG
jgi:hypothetical protein